MANQVQLTVNVLNGSAQQPVPIILSFPTDQISVQSDENSGLTKVNYYPNQNNSTEATEVLVSETVSEIATLAGVDMFAATIQNVGGFTQPTGISMLFPSSQPQIGESSGVNINSVIQFKGILYYASETADSLVASANQTSGGGGGGVTIYKGDGVVTAGENRVVGVPDTTSLKILATSTPSDPNSIASLLALTSGDVSFLSMGATDSGGNAVAVQTGVVSGSALLQIQDNRASPTGMIYTADYSAGFVDRSLVDKAYADKQSFYNSDGQYPVSAIRTVDQNSGTTAFLNGNVGIGVPIPSQLFEISDGTNVLISVNAGANETDVQARSPTGLAYLDLVANVENSFELFAQDNNSGNEILLYADANDGNIEISAPNGVQFLIGKTTFQASVVSGASFNLPVGSAPTSPVDGDVWREDNTNTGVKIRVNGVTKTIVLV